MLDEFVRTVYETKTKKDQTTKLASAMEVLPTDELKKIARFGLGRMLGGGGESWIEKYQGSPLFENAMQLEQQYLQLELQQTEADNARQQQYAGNDQLRAAQDAICVQKRMLDLQLAQQGHQQGAEEELSMMQGQADEAKAPPGPPGGAPPPEGAPPAEAAPKEEPPAGDKPAEKKEPTGTTVSVKQAAVRMRQRMAMEKEALGIVSAGKGLMRAFKRGGFGAASSRAGRMAGGGAKRIGAWAKKNPGAAMGAAAGAAGAAGTAAGFLGGRASK